MGRSVAAAPPPIGPAPAGAVGGANIFVTIEGAAGADAPAEKLKAVAEVCWAPPKMLLTFAAGGAETLPVLPKENVLLAGAPPVLLPKLNGAAMAVAVAPPFVDPPPNANGVALDATAGGLLPIVLVPKEKPPTVDLLPAAANRFDEVLLLLTVVGPPKLNVLFV